MEESFVDIAENSSDGMIQDNMHWFKPGVYWTEGTQRGILKEYQIHHKVKMVRKFPKFYRVFTAKYE